jgi:hypothetical protein|tara:strand:+ start:1100 stop:1564 length:465 start_codon:yes stop_codon:yes gene_type:complete
MNEKKIIREFLDNMQDYSLDSSQEKNYQALPAGDSHHDLDPDGDGHVTPEDLYSHFDLNNNGQVTTQEYVDHIDFHCAHPESLDHYSKAREHSIQSVPCKNSYDSCSQHLMGTPDDIDKFLKPLMDYTGSTCRESSTKALLDVLQSLINCGVFG